MSVRTTASAVERWMVHLAVALLLGVVAGAVAVAVLHHVRGAAIDEQRFHAPPSDRIDAAVAALRQDGVYVAPDGRGILDAAGEAGVERAVASSSVPVYVVVWAPDEQIGMSTIQAGEALAAALDQPRGVLFLWEGPEQGDVEVLGPGGYLDGDLDSQYDFVGDPAVTLPQAVAAAASDVHYVGGGSDGDYWGGVGGGTVLGVLLAAGVLAVVLLLGWVASLIGGRRLPGSWRPREDAR